MLYQMLWQNKKDHSTEFVAQKEIDENLSIYNFQEALDYFVQEIQEKYPIDPNAYSWLICSEKSKEFKLTISTE